MQPHEEWLLPSHHPGWILHLGRLGPESLLSLPLCPGRHKGTWRAENLSRDEEDASAQLACRTVVSTALATYHQQTHRVYLGCMPAIFLVFRNTSWGIHEVIWWVRERLWLSGCSVWTERITVCDWPASFFPRNSIWELNEPPHFWWADLGRKRWRNQLGVTSYSKQIKILTKKLPERVTGRGCGNTQDIQNLLASKLLKRNSKARRPLLY